jgi:beta-glucosidase
VRLPFAAVIATAVSVLACGALLSLARASTTAGGNLAQARADVSQLDGTLVRLVKRMEGQAQRPGLARVRIDGAALLRTIKGLEVAKLHAVKQFPALLGGPNIQTFIALDCTDSGVALGSNVLLELQGGRFKSRPGRAGTYAFGVVLAYLGKANACAASLARGLAKESSAPHGLVGRLRGLSTAFLGLTRRTKAQQRKADFNTRPLLRTLASIEASEMRAVAQLPSVFGLPYVRTFGPLACIDTQLASSEEVLRQRRQGRLNTEGRNPDTYPFKVVLAGFKKAKGCTDTLQTVLLHAAAATTQPATSAHPSTPTRPAPPIYLDTHYSFAERAADLVSRMTLAEKVAQLRTNSAPAIPRLGLQQYTYWNEGQHGVNALGADTNRGSAGSGPNATSFPTNFAATMSWDPRLMYEETTAISDEVRGFLDKSLWNTGQNNIGPSPSDYGSLTFWAPTVNMDRDPRWGRTDEAFGEDPYLVSRMAGAFVDGYQGESISGQPLTPYLKVAATAKHFALNDVEQNREAISSDTNDTELHDYYTAQFKSLIEDAHVSGLMTSLNAIDGTPAMADTYTTNQVAERTYGFNGYTTSDCALSNIYRTSPNGHNWAPPGWTTDGQNLNATWTNSATGAKVSGAAGAQAYALRAGTELNCTGSQATLTNIQQAISAGMLSEGVIDNALVRLFTMRMMTGEFDPPSRVPYTSITKAAIQSPAHQALAEQVAANSLVLLKNADVSATTTPLLPVHPAGLNKVEILGDLANKVTLGGYSGSPSLRVSAVQGITAAVHAGNPNASVVYDTAGTSTTATSAAVLSAQTQADIQSADLVIVFVGTDGSVASEGHDRSTLAMPGNYESLIDQVAAIGNPRMALVIQSDGPVDIANEQSKFPAILFSGYNGESQGTALADGLFGNQDPSGHLDFTWYNDDSQLPDMSNYGLTPSATGGLGRTYMYFTGTPTYPFGFGLSYTQFRFSNLQVGPSSTSADGTVNVTFDVTNTGTTRGAAVAQLYVATPFSVPGVELPVKRLEGFQKTAVLQPGEKQTVNLTVSVADLAFWDWQAARSVVDNGAYQFEVGSDSSNIAASQTIQVMGALTPSVKYVTVQPEDVVYKPGDTVDLTGKNVWIADDTDHAREQRNLAVTADAVVEAVNGDGSFVDLSHAHVSYASSNDHVAAVSSTGVMSAVAPGVATIRVTVDGVTGAAVVVVKQPLGAWVSNG